MSSSRGNTAPKRSLGQTSESLGVDRQSPMHLDDWVRESRFGRWFQGTAIWRDYVIGPAMTEAVGLLRGQHPPIGQALDLGSGHGFGIELIEAAFHPERIVAIDIDETMLESSRQRLGALHDRGHGRAAGAAPGRSEIEITRGDGRCLDAADASFDLVLCHQLLHHVSDQRAVLSEIHRVLRPGGIALIGETCRRYIRMLPVRLLFRHPTQVQKDADGYVSLVREAGFAVDPDELLAHSPWWSLWHLGLLEDRGEHTEVLMVARKR